MTHAAKAGMEPIKLMPTKVKMNAKPNDADREALYLESSHVLSRSWRPGNGDMLR